MGAVASQSHGKRAEEFVSRTRRLRWIALVSSLVGEVTSRSALWHFSVDARLALSLLPETSSPWRPWSVVGARRRTVSPARAVPG